MRGDLVLYKSSGLWYERAITLATHGPFVHVAIVTGDQRVIAARARGIGYEELPAEDTQHVRLPIGEKTTSLQINNALLWAMGQQGKAYGWSDIAYQGLKFLWPHNPLRWGWDGHYDCSDFATRYLLHAGVALPDEFLDTYTVTPNDLARWGGLLPPMEGALA